MKQLYTFTHGDLTKACSALTCGRQIPHPSKVAVTVSPLQLRRVRHEHWVYARSAQRSQTEETARTGVGVRAFYADLQNVIGREK